MLTVLRRLYEKFSSSVHSNEHELLFRSKVAHDEPIVFSDNGSPRGSDANSESDSSLTTTATSNLYGKSSHCLRHTRTGY